MSKESYFIGCAEVAELVGCGKSRAYKYIQQMNQELEARGNLTFPGRVPRRYAMDRFGLLEEVREDESTNARAAGSGGSKALVWRDGDLLYTLTDGRSNGEAKALFVKRRSE